MTAGAAEVLYICYRKSPASLLHLKKGTVRRKVVIALAVGSIPGSVCGVKLLMHIRHLYGDGVNSFIKTAVGVLLIVIPTLLLFQRKIEERVVNSPPTAKSFIGMAGIGAGAGFLWGLNLCGSGSLVMLCLSRS